MKRGWNYEKIYYRKNGVEQEYKTLLENEKMLVTTMSSKEILTESLKLRNFFLTHSHTMTPFDAPGNKRFENTVGKGEIARNEQFLLFPQCFLPVWITFFHFRQI